MARCRSIALVLEKRLWREFRKSWRVSSAGLLHRCSHQARSFPIRSRADTPKTRPGRAWRSSSNFREIFDELLVLRGLAALVGDNAFRRWTPRSQPGAAARFFCDGKFRLALLA